MVAITVVEPNTLLRLGLLNLLKTLDCRTASQGMDYGQLFNGAPSHGAGADLMLLSAPSTYDHVKELLSTAQRRFEPHRILLLSETQEPPYSLLNLPSALVGYVCKFASAEILKTSIMLVLSGGKCFPPPNIAQAHTPDTSAAGGDAPPRRRWYDHEETSCPPAGDLAQPGTPLPPWPPSPVQQETKLLHLTPRQYDILVLMAKGYPLKQISRELAISVATVKTHTEALYLRLGVNSRNAAVYAAISRGATLGCWHGPQDPANRPILSQTPADTSD